jgi:hypothetical protein
VSRCLFVGCPNERAQGDTLCASCGFWARVTLLDPYYRDHTPPLPGEAPTRPVQQPVVLL